MKAYLQFLSFQLARFNAFNRLFQSTFPRLQQLRPEVLSLLKTFAGDFLNAGYVLETPAADIDPSEANRVALE